MDARRGEAEIDIDALIRRRGSRRRWLTAAAVAATVVAATIGWLLVRPGESVGIRRAVGATSGDIVRQFVTEALTLSLCGGLAGIAIGIAASLAVDGRELGGQAMATLIQPWSIAAAFAVGLASGSYPAWRATAVDPIAALHNE